jgi:hypothetical protein
MNEDKVLVVTLYRSDLPQPLEVKVTNSDEEAIQALKELDTMWVDSVEKKHPFRIAAPYKGSFAPGLIKEIRIEEYTVEEYQHLSNPYQKQAEKQGLTNWMGQNFQK